MQCETQPNAPGILWEQISPLLDEGLAQLGEKDRQAILLRFFESKSLAEDGNFLGTGEDTARRRISRALEKLRRYFMKRGVDSTAELIAGAISTHSLQAIPHWIGHHHYCDSSKRVGCRGSHPDPCERNT